MALVEFASTSDHVCGWVTLGCADSLGEPGPENEVGQAAVNTAAEILYALSGRQFGVCPTTVRPCRTACADERSVSGYRWTPVLAGGQWTNVSCSDCGDLCSCRQVCDVLLPGPIHSITEVLLDGVIVDPNTYKVGQKRSLVRKSGNPCWPLCQDMSKDSSEVGTWEVSYLRGKPLPQSGRQAMTLFAAEIAKSCQGQSCDLPKRLTSITRQGATMAVLDPMPFLKESRTGLYLVDAWLQAVNPQKRVRGAGIYSPDMPTSERFS